MKTVNKTVNYKGGKIKVTFGYKSPMRKSDSDTISNVLFYINGKEYDVTLKVTPIVCQNGSNGYSREYTYDGYTIPENDKKMIEHIINVNGL